MTNGLDTLEKRIGYRFKDQQVLQQALIHSSYSAVGKQQAQSNERMEFFGDRVLGLVIAELLYERFHDEQEGELARRFTALARMEALARVGGNIDLAQHIVMSQGEDEMGGRENASIVADTCEALICALYLDGGLGAAKKFIRDNWVELLNEDPTPPKDAKTTLQEWAQSRTLGLPVYETLATSGPSHAPVFQICVKVTGLPDQKAEGTSKRKAEQRAAEAMLDYIENNFSADD